MKKDTIIFTVLFLLLTTVCGLSTASAAVPHLINYQGRLTDKSGQPLEGSYKVTLRIYDAETGPGTMTPWEEVHANVVIQKGVFSILLGSVKVLDLAFDKPYWLEIKVGEDIMKPRQQITSVGYAIRAEKAELAQNTEKVNQFSAIPANDSSIATPSAFQKLVALDENGKFPPEVLPMFSNDNNFIFSVLASKSSVNKSGTYTFSNSIDWTEIWSDEIYIGKGVNILKMNCDMYGYGNTYVRFMIGSQYSDEQECHDNNWAGGCIVTMLHPPKGKQKVRLQLKFRQAGDQSWGSGGVRNAYFYIP